MCESSSELKQRPPFSKHINDNSLLNSNLALGDAFK